MLAMNAPNNIKAIRERRHMSLEELAEKAKISVSYLSRLESGKRNLSVKNIEKLAGPLEVSPPELVVDNNSQLQFDPAKRLPIIGEVRAGAWLEIEHEPEVYDRLPITADDRFPELKQFSLLVVGTSMDKVFAPGSYVIAVEWIAEGTTDLKDGDLLVVRRQRAMTFECTLKRARFNQGVWELWPESTDPRHQEPIQLHDGDREVEVKILGRVIGKYQPL